LVRPLAPPVRPLNSGGKSYFWARGGRRWRWCRVYHRDTRTPRGDTARTFGPLARFDPHTPDPARPAVDPTGRSVLYGRKTTALTWKLERSAWLLSRYAGRWWDRDYYRTYREGPGDPPGYWGVQAEVTRMLASPTDFRDVPANAPHRWRKTSGLVRDSLHDERPAFVLRDDNYVSARWPGDVHTFARAFAAMLDEPTAPARQFGNL